MDVHIQLKQLTVKFKDVTAVDDVTIDIKEGELVSLLGPSGCGKSTTLYTIAGLYQPSAGEIHFKNQCVNEIPSEKRNIGMVFQDYALYPHMTVKNNIAFPLKMNKISKKEIDDKVMAIANLVHIGHLLNRKPGQLSGGQQQRVAIARALIKEPDILLLDEPLSNLDAGLRVELRSEIRRIQRQLGITTIFVTHDQEEAVSISDSIILMHHGKIQQYGCAETLYDQPSNLFVSEFLGQPKINTIPIEVIDGHFFWEESSTVSLKNGKYILALRPEHIEICSMNKSNITGIIHTIERSGREFRLRIQCDKFYITCYCPKSFAPSIGMTVGLLLDISKAHFFDSLSEVRVALHE